MILKSLKAKMSVSFCHRLRQLPGQTNVFGLALMECGYCFIN